VAGQLTPVACAIRCHSPRFTPARLSAEIPAWWNRSASMSALSQISLTLLTQRRMPQFFEFFFLR
jgi:hypothetical protein